MEARPGMELDMHAPATLVGELPFGNGKIGINPRLRTHEAKQEFGQQLGTNTGVITPGFENVSFCIEDRPWEMIGGITDPDELAELTTYQTAGGDVYSALFALMATRSNLLDDQNNINDKAKAAASWLKSFGFGLHVHENCGAADILAKTSEHIVSLEEAVAAFSVWGPVSDEDKASLATIVENVTEFSNSSGHPYSLDVFNPGELREYIKQQDPRFYTKVVVDPTDKVTGGHKALGLYLPAEGGLVKNRFIRDTGQMAFTYTDKFAERLAGTLSPHDQAQAHILHLAIRYHQLVAGKALFAPGMPVFKQASTPLAA